MNRCQKIMFATVTHELRTPLNGIMGNNKLLEDYVDNDRGRKYL